MTTLEIGRLTASVYVDAEDAETGQGRSPDLARAFQRLADHALADRLDAAGLPGDGVWCVRRVATTLHYDPGASPSHLESQWADVVLGALGEAIGHPVTGPEHWSGGEEVLHYRHSDDAVLDLVGTLAAGRRDRCWAWRQMGLVSDLAVTDRATVMSVLARHPHLVLAVLRAAVAAGHAAGLHRLLGTDGWVTVAGFAAGASGATDTWQAGAAAEYVPPEEATGSPPDLKVLPPSPLLRALLGTGLRPDRRTARAWSLLALLDVDPAALRRDAHASRLEALASVVLHSSSPAARWADDRSVFPTSPADEDPRARSARTDPTATVTTEAEPKRRARAAIEPDAPAALGAPTGHDVHADESDQTPESDPGAATAWGGLPFLIRSAARAGLPALLEDRRLSGRNTRWMLHALAGRLAPVAPEDPAALALAGVLPSAPPPESDAPNTEEDAALAEVTDAWCRATHAMVAVGDASAYAALDPSAAVRRIAARRAVVLGEPGWVEVVLPLDEVDVDIRMAGLDLDPGWVPWLGTVMRFRYE
jgi:hypothetical protein